MPSDDPAPPASPREPLELQPGRPPRWLKPAGVVGVGLAAVVVVSGLVTRGFASEALKATTAEAATPTVALIRVAGGDAAQRLTLPADIEADDVAVMHAQVSGYVKAWRVDIGARVHKGQVLAEIETPEIDQQLAQARAALATAKANQQFAQISAQRWDKLLTRDAVSKQEADQKASELAVQNANVQAAQANLDRLAAQEAFKRIVSPFDGVVTARNAHVGMLVTANAANEPGLFTVADDHRLRVYVSVPQDYSAEIRPGMTAQLSVPQFPNRRFQATLAGTSEAVGQQSGALTAELQIDNGDHVLQPGDYAQASFELGPPSGGPVMRLPASALMFRHSGMAVGVVDASGRAHIRDIRVQRDLGTAVEVASGVAPGERVIDNPPDSLTEGELVRIAGAGRG